MAVIALTMRAKQPKRGIVACEHGYIEINEYPRAAEAEIVYTADGRREKISAGESKKALEYEITDMENYVESKRNVLSPTTIRGYNTLIRNAYTDILNIKTKKITQQIIQEWVNKYSIGHAPKTVSNAHGFLSSVLGVYEPSIVLRTTLPEAKDPDLYTPSDKEIERLLNLSKSYLKQLSN